MRLPATRTRRRSTVLGEPFLRAVSTGAVNATAVDPAAQPVDPFKGMVNLLNRCFQAEAEIAGIEEALARDPDALPPEAIVAPVRKLLDETQSDIERLPPGAASQRVVEAARREGLALTDRVLEADARADKRFKTGAINAAADRLAAKVAQNPGALDASLTMLNDLIDTADLDAGDRRLVAANLEARVRSAANPQDRQVNALAAEVSQTRDGGEPAVETVPLASGQPRSDLSGPLETQQNGPGGETVRGRARADRSDRANRNEILDSQGFQFVDGSGGGFWVDREGKRTDPKALREVVSQDIERRAVQQGWTSAGILTELHRAKSGLPVEDRKNIEKTFAFLPIVAPLLASGATGGVAATGGAAAAGGAAVGGAATTGAAVSVGVLLKAIVGGLGLAAILGLSGDTPLKEIEEIDQPDDGATLGSEEDAQAVDSDDDQDPALPVPPAVPPVPDKDDDDDRETVTVYRVEGDQNRRILIDRFGKVTITDKSGEMLHVNFGERQRAIEFLEKRLLRRVFTNVVIKSFNVPREFLDALDSASIPEFGATRADPQRLLPRRVDPNQAINQFQLPRVWIEALREAIVQGTGTIETPEDVGLR